MQRTLKREPFVEVAPCGVCLLGSLWLKYNERYETKWLLLTSIINVATLKTDLAHVEYLFHITRVWKNIFTELLTIFFYII